jgi:hypothetical protein
MLDDTMKDYVVKGRITMAAIMSITILGLKMMEQRGLPILKKEKQGSLYHVPTVWKWREEDIRRQAGVTASRQAPAEGVNAQSRRQIAEARRAEIEVAQLEETLVDADEIRTGLEGMIIHARTLALGVPAQIGREIDEPGVRVQVVAVVDRRIREMLEGMARYDPLQGDEDREAASEGDDQDGSGAISPAAQVDHQSVGGTKPLPQSRRGRKRAVAE